MLPHLILHLHEVGSHGLLDFGVLLLDKVHHRSLKLIAAHTCLDKQLVIDLGLIDEHVNHQIHLAVGAHLGLLLEFSLLAHCCHRLLLRDLEGGQSLLLCELRRSIFLFCGILFFGQLALLCGHHHLLELRPLRHSLHGHLELFLISVEDAHHLLHKRLAHPIVLLELLLDDSAILGIIFVLVELKALLDGRISLD